MLIRNPTCNGCEKCGNTLSGLTRCCCTHTCHAICVTLEGGCDDGGYADCSCDEPAFAYLEYNPTTESYTGEIGCGDILIDLEFVIKYCKESESCVICLISECLTSSYNESFDGECDNLVSCKPIPATTESCVGTIDSNGALVGGIEHEWEVDVSGCGDTDCTSFVIKTVCTDRIFPEEITENEYESGCIGCQCLCQDLCISYRGHNTCEDSAKVAIDGDTWSFEVTRCDEADPDQQGRTITIVLQKNVYTDECELLVTTPFIDSMGNKSTQETIVELNECPDVPYTKIWVDQTEGDYFEFECWKCGLCPDELICVCECDPDSADSRGYLIPETLTLEWFAYDHSGSNRDTVTLVRLRESCEWVHTRVYQCQVLPGRPPVRVSEVATLTPSTISPGCGWNLSFSSELLGNPNDLDPNGPPCSTPFFGHIADHVGIGPWLGETTCECNPLLLTFQETFSEDSGASAEVTE